MDLIPNVRRRDVMFAIYSVEEAKHAIASGRFGAITEGQKKACARVETVLRSLQVALRAVPRRHEFPLDDDELTGLHKHFGRAARQPARAHSYRSINYGKRQAAIEAALLLTKCGLPVTTTQPKRASNGRPPNAALFCRLTAILYGEPNANMYQICLSVKKAGLP